MIWSIKNERNQAFFTIHLSPSDMDSRPELEHFWHISGTFFLARRDGF